MAKRRDMHTKRKRSLRSILVERQGRRCFYCQRFVAIPPRGTDTVIEDGEKLWATIDHLVPLAKGGSHALSNLLLACYLCHQRRHGARP